ncbi:hypothetical protein [Enterococcus hirae]|uniref:hypothetical protein n=1 Tax=Enterococcus hirae TaxID=1354 RepID=UPI0015F2521C|nr:hypothetical protein [Enterococcus hirae]MBA5253873.1 hypothetical protein [Enterococcus hirae]MCK6145662.1 hypothetical protein [Enterococcus hirae]MCK6173120.1 hypothetical protein [Enterococcus hirae]
MTVKELISKLEMLDQNKKMVFVNVYDDGADESEFPDIVEEDNRYFVYANS